MNPSALAAMRVPADLSVVGFDEFRAARQVRPALTTIQQPAADVGYQLIQALLPALEGNKPEHQEQTVPLQLVLRDSSGPPPTEDPTP